jgi:hypothetical protein
MVDAVDSLTLVIAQAPEAARMQMAVQQATLASVLTSGDAVHALRVGEQVLNVTPPSGRC